MPHYSSFVTAIPAICEIGLLSGVHMSQYVQKQVLSSEVVLMEKG